MKIYLTLILFITSFAAHAQWKGLTGIADTSFTVRSAFQKAKKDFPDIQMPAGTLPADVTIVKDLEYKKTAQRSLKLDVFSPVNTSGKRPAVLLIFGGGWRSGDKTQLHAIAAQLAKNGFVSFTADYRLSTEALYPAAVEDLKEAVIWIRENAETFNVDTSRVATLGFSAGGQLAALVGNTGHSGIFNTGRKQNGPSDAIQAVVDIDGVLAYIHPESGEGDDSKSVSAATNWFGGNKVEKKAMWEQASPLRYVTAQSPPILFINSSVERMHAGREDMRKKLDAFGIYSEVRTFPEAPHVFPLFHPWFEPTVGYAAGFLKKVFGE
ncbi:alpha/beta hydrolase [Dyadobacter flavalbus]|uniref:Alpha/beta hydrolase n=1 Tax=Dyadobacter flavalbus TaxID=2579942 RepID=A0A5M8QT32_9BACT|nr:alpha/beta hydrolase [Dyadobacter flavalbus]KAA6438421.1 alpha/beta hydrolase [Dyadobacter flavalbus]